MNGRIYDQNLGRFLSADPFVQFPESTQGYNRYTYVGNNPLSYTDPSGYFLEKLLGGALFTDVKQFAPTLIGLAMCGASAGLGCAIGAGALSGAVGGFLATGTMEGAAKGAVIGAISGAIAFKIGAAYEAGNINLFEKSLLHGMSQGALSAAGGGRFGDGFLGAFAGSMASPLTNSIGGNTMGGRVARVISAAVIGGSAAKLGGGRFANGAITAAFVQAFNDNVHQRQNPTDLSISEEGLQAIAAHESFSAEIYPDQAGHDTIGYGHKLRPGEADLYKNGITKEQAWELLRQDVKTAQLAVQQNVSVPLSQNEFDALVSFTYNVGGGAFASSTMLQHLNSGNYSAAADQFPRWNKITRGGQVFVSNGLTNRRISERCMFLGGQC